MFRRTAPQVSLLETRFLLPPAKRERLAKSWAQPFHDRVLPLIDEECLRGCFDQETGRPNRSIRLLTGVHLLKEWNDLTDEQALENLEFNLQWQYALGITAEEAHLPQRTLHSYRARLLESGKAEELFNAITKGLVEVDGLSVSRQRLDSTHLISDMKVLTRLGLFVETETRFLNELKAASPEKVEGLETAIARRYLNREGYFSDAKRDQARRRLPIAAQDLLYLVRRFEKDSAVNGWESYLLMKRLLEEQCDVTGGDDDGGSAGGDNKVERIVVKEPKEISGATLQSPHDPDATYGHKGKGYEAQVAETCVGDNPYQVVTHVEINGANESDQNATVPVVAKLVEKGFGPKEVLADTGFGSGENIVACAEMGVELICPVRDPDTAENRDPRWEPGPETTPETPCAEEKRPEPLGLEDFTFDDTFAEIESCPAGKAPEHQEPGAESRFHKATFSGEHCRGCPFADRCPTRVDAKTGDRTMKWENPKAATASRQREQKESTFKGNYRKRSGIESTMEEIKGRHGAGDLRVRRRPRVDLVMYLKCMALNTKRAVQYHLIQLSKSLEEGHEVAAEAR